LIETIKSAVKVFYNLDIQNGKLLQEPCINVHWCICGSRRERLVNETFILNNEEKKLKIITCAGVQCRLIKANFRNEYEYVYLEAITARDGFPDDYTGFSGGGIWYQRFITDDDINYRVEPILAGVVVWQRNQKGLRIIEGHFSSSIYYNVRKALHEYSKGHSLFSKLTPLKQ